MRLNFLYPKYDINILSKFTLVETSLAFKTESNNFALRIWIHVQDNIKWIRTLIVLKYILFVWYAKKILILINFA